MQDSAPEAGTKVGRNDLCPCGSGRKYKKCCLEKDEQTQRPRTSEPAPEQAEQAFLLLNAAGGSSRPSRRERTADEKTADALRERFAALPDPTAAQLDELLDGLLQLPPGVVAWQDVLSMTIARHAPMDRVAAAYHRIVTSVPGHPDSNLALLHWEAADLCVRRRRTDLLPEVAEAFHQIHHDAYEEAALSFLEDALLAAHFEDEALRLAEHFLPRTREAVNTRRLFTTRYDHQCALILDLRIGRLMRAEPEGGRTQEAVLADLRQGFDEDDMDAAYLQGVAATICDTTPSRPWARKDFALGPGKVGEAKEVRRAKELYGTLMRVAREAWRRNRHPPGVLLSAFVHLLGAAREVLEWQQRRMGKGKVAQGSNLLDYLDAGGLEDRIERDCVRDMIFSLPQAQLTLEACGVLLELAREHLMLPPDSAAATAAELTRLNSKEWDL